MAYQKNNLIYPSQLGDIEYGEKTEISSFLVVMIANSFKQDDTDIEP